MARVGLLALVAFSLARVAHAGAPPESIAVVVDDDDDDVNGTRDADEVSLSHLARVDLVSLGEPGGVRVVATEGSEHARLVVSGRPVAWGGPVPVGAEVQGLSPGIVDLEVYRGSAVATRTITVARVGFRDGAGRDVNPTTSHASLERVPPSETNPGESAPYDDPDALRVFVVTPSTTPPALAVESVGASGAHLDLLEAPHLAAVPCSSPTAPASSAKGPLHCFASEPLRFVIDDVDRRHALAVARSLRAELGGAIVLRQDGRKLQAIRVLGPRDTAAGPIGRLRATMRPIVVRVSPGGTPAIGGNDAGAVAALRAELSNAAAVWGQCGVSFGPVDTIPVRVADPPPPHLLSIGDDLGLPASGGVVEFKVGSVVVTTPTRAGELPEDVADDVARAALRGGLIAVVSPNARVASAANRSADLSIRRHDGALATVEAVHPGDRLSTDPTLTVRIGSVELRDGLAHFGDIDSVAGTLEERTLLKALDDQDPRTLEVVVVPFFAGGGRIGESFIGSDHSSLRNVVILDRAGVRARRSSLTLAHELGHVLLDIPGHPDDFGVDTPTRLMDADASDASPFGPRRLTLDECARVVRQSGPDARSPLLAAWPVTPLSYAPLTVH